MFGWIYTVDKTIVGSLWLIYVDITLVSRCYMIEFINLLVEIPSSIGRTPLLWGFESPTLGDIYAMTFPGQSRPSKESVPCRILVFVG